MDKYSIFVKDYITICSIGVYPKEKQKKQKIKISVKLDLKKVKKYDLIDSTVSYEKIISILQEIKNFKHINLLETLSKKILTKLEKIENLKKMKIEIVKCNILNGNQEVGVTLERSIKK